MWLGLHEVNTLSFSGMRLLHRLSISGCETSVLSPLSLYFELHDGAILSAMFDVVSFTLAIHFMIVLES